MIVGLSLAAVLAWGDARSAHADVPSALIEGPSLLCFMHSRFQLAAGERVTDFSLGIHVMSINVAGPRGQYTVSEGNHFGTPRRLGRTVYETETLSVHQLRRNGAIQYAVMGFADFAPNERRVLIWLSGPALGGSSGEQVFRRLTVGDPARAKCDRGFRYGWNFED